MNRHPMEEKIRQLLAGSLPDEERLQLAEHISGCPDCAELLASCMEEGALLSPPAGMKQQVRSKLRHRQRELWMYSLRVSAAACAALFIMFVGVRSYKPVEIKTPSMAITHKINYKLNEFSNKIINGGTMRNEKTK